MGKVLKGVGKFLVGGVVGGLLGLTGKSKAPSALASPTRDDALAQIENEDELRRRKGAASDIINGSTGAEAALGTTGRFVPGS
ncbi:MULTISPECIES: hypothetical protein [unclassified Novosphingobium]|uniref:hypothetical protein n=1 Tax=unclassified Novosphingobium TaxID=2644732 RepID=UPI0006C8ABEF|nr:MULTISPECIES: hypothetical protein [unclassified Novosphingobium]KPH66337.1 hypothetical protein ADT71_06620 [Novosphingobium sp. ST904]TCM42084.1 hypothetical protein EDF59_10245 [Novosphingobium sp. ST904]WRT91353.1 hypothetical protein U9J33_08925 [Novosphingobium sp. RL4]